MQKVNNAGEFRKPVVTEIKPLEAFYEAEDYHRDYFEIIPTSLTAVRSFHPKVPFSGKKPGQSHRTKVFLNYGNNSCAVTLMSRVAF